MALKYSPPPMGNKGIVARSPASGRGSGRRWLAGYINGYEVAQHVRNCDDCMYSCSAMVTVSVPTSSSVLVWGI